MDSLNYIKSDGYQMYHIIINNKKECISELDLLNFESLFNLPLSNSNVEQIKNYWNNNVTPIIRYN
jgi:hypothetical protein